MNQTFTIQSRTLQKQMYMLAIIMKQNWMKKKIINTSENTKTNKNSLETILEHNKHEIDPKTNNDNQEQSTSEMVAE